MHRLVILLWLISGSAAFSQQGLLLYYGNLHSHTNFSDGTGTVYEAYTFARDSAHLDFLAVTDHVEYLSYLNFMTGINTAAGFTQDSIFVAFYGYEWTSPYYGHCDVFNTNVMIAPSSSSMYPGGWDFFTDFLSDNPPAFGQFNHPGRYTSFNNWDTFAYVSPSVDTLMPLIEFQNPTEAANFYELALSKGWHLSPVWNQDNHYGDWGLKNNGRAGIWAESLTKNNLLEAIKHRRTFATMDYNASIWIESGNQPMGSVIPFTNPYDFHLVLEDDTDHWYRVEVVTNHGIAHQFFPDSSFVDTVIQCTDSMKWLFVRAVQNDGDMIWSAPLFFQVPTSGLIGKNDNPCKIITYTEGNRFCATLENSPHEMLQAMLMDVSGKFISTAESESGTLCMDLPGPGVYLVRMQTRQSMQYIKVISGGSR